jgi:hypothetical protein
MHWLRAFIITVALCGALALSVLPPLSVAVIAAFWMIGPFVVLM